MAPRDGFQLCLIDSSVALATNRRERRYVAWATALHVLDVGSDLCVAVLFLSHALWGFCVGIVVVIIWAWLVSSLYVTFGSGNSAGDGDIDAVPGPGGFLHRLPVFLRTFLQVQFFTEAYRCVFRGGDADFFHTLRLMEALLQAAPNALLQLYAFIAWSVPGDAPASATVMICVSALLSCISLGCGLSMWERKAQCRATSWYVLSVAVMRFLEISSRGLTLAIFSGATYPHGFWFVMMMDYCVMLVAIKRHHAVQFTYGLFVAVPLILVSIEPFVWRREDHAVPKDVYYMVRVLELACLWIVIIQASDPHIVEQKDHVGLSVHGNSMLLGCEALALLATLGMYVSLPFVWRTARRNEIFGDVQTWSEESDGSCGDPDGFPEDDRDRRQQEDTPLRAVSL